MGCKQQLNFIFSRKNVELFNAYFLESAVKLQTEVSSVNFRFLLDSTSEEAQQEAVGVESIESEYACVTVTVTGAHPDCSPGTILGYTKYSIITQETCRQLTLTYQSLCLSLVDCIKCPKYLQN